MPELPDVETFKRYFDATALRRKVSDVEVRNTKVLDGISSRKLKQAGSEKRFKSTRRHGKHLFIALDGTQWLVVHFGMTGFFEYFKDTPENPNHSRVVFDLDNGYHLAYVNQRLLGRVGLASDVDTYVRENKLGPAAWSVGFEQFAELVASKRSAVKSALMDQSLMAGVGNIYSDEILFQAGISPKRTTGDLSRGEVRTLHKALNKVLSKAVEKQANPKELPRTYLLRRREEGGQCPKCGGDIEKMKVSGRSGYFCPKCQK